MVRKNKTNNKKSRNGKGRARPRAANVPFGGAAVAVSRDLQQYTSFSAGRSRDSLRMRTCAAIAQIQRSTSATTVGCGLQLPSGNQGTSLQLNLTQPALLQPTGTKSNEGFVSPVFDLIASAFVKYRVNSLRFHYEPQASATTTERLVFAFAEDPMHPLLWNATPPTSSSLLALADSEAFAPWRSWSMDVSHRVNNQEFYTLTDPSTTVASFAERLSDFGVISCVTSSVAGTSTICGVLYMEIEIELIEFCPISVTLPASKHLAKKFSAAASSSSYRLPTVVEVEKISDREARRLCEQTVRDIEKLDPRVYSFFRADWPAMLEGRPHELLAELQEKLGNLRS